MPRPVKAELQPFIELNKQEKSQGAKIPWKDRYALICSHFPAAERLDWRAAFRDEGVWGRLVYDLLVHDQKAEWDGKGPRPPFDPKRARERLNQWMGNDYSYVEFEQTFNTLVGERSLRHIASKMGVSAHFVWKLKNGTASPDLYTLERIAKAFKKDPSYFLEYRIAYVLGALGDQMDLAPEISVDLYRRVRRGRA